MAQATRFTYYVNNEVQMTKCLFVAESTNSLKNEGHPSNI